MTYENGEKQLDGKNIIEKEFGKRHITLSTYKRFLYIADRLYQSVPSSLVSYYVSIHFYLWLCLGYVDSFQPILKSARIGSFSSMLIVRTLKRNSIVCRLWCS